MAKKTHKKKTKQNLNKLILIIIGVIVIGYVVYINKDKFFPEKTEKITIIVNDGLITSEELDENYRVAKKQNQILTREEFLEQMIITALLLQEADKEGIYVNDNEIIKEVNDLMMSFGSEEEVNQALNELGVTTEMLKTQIKKQLLINKLINKTIISKIEVSDPEIKSFYDSNKEFMENISFSDVKEQVKSILINEKVDNILQTYIKQIRSNANIIIGKETEKTKLRINSFVLTNEDICRENGKPVIRLFSTTTCPQCSLIRDIFDSTVKELIKEGKISAYHWELDIGDNTLTPEKEGGIPKSEVEIFKKYNSRSTVPTYVFGCRYIRIGNAYEKEYLEGEQEEIKNTIEELTT